MTTRTRLFLGVSLLIAFTDALFVWINYRAEQTRFQHFLEQRAQYLGSLFTAALDDTALRMQQTATYIASIPEIQADFLEGRRAVESEGGGAGGVRAQLARCQLLTRVSGPWEELQRLYDTRQLHFQFGENATSFLRVHKPDEFGDDLNGVRFTIQDALQRGQPTMGFECGRVVCGIRGVVPVTAEDPADPGQTLLIGVLEAGTSYQSLLQLVEKSSHAQFAVLLDLEHARETMWPHHLAQHLADSPPIGPYLIESSLHPEIRALLDNPCVRSLAQGFGVGWCLDAGREIAAAAFPLHDYRGRNDPARPPVGTVLTWSDVALDLARLRQDLYTNIGYALGVLLLVEILLFLAFRAATQTLERVIDEKTRMLRELTIHDQLTGLYNRRYLTERLAKETARAHRNDLVHLSLAMVDLDHFKSINDRFGHVTGDRVLSGVAHLIQSRVRASDYVFRFGGEEFLILLTDTPLPAAIAVCEELCAQLAASAIVTLPSGGVTASFGVAELNASHCLSTENLLKCADRALYRAKANGRNRVESFPFAQDA